MRRDPLARKGLTARLPQAWRQPLAVSGVVIALAWLVIAVAAPWLAGGGGGGGAGGGGGGGGGGGRRGAPPTTRSPRTCRGSPRRVPATGSGPTSSGATSCRG
jgi:hypothetical protein